MSIKTALLHCLKCTKYFHSRYSDTHDKYSVEICHHCGFSFDAEVIDEKLVSKATLQDVIDFDNEQHSKSIADKATEFAKEMKLTHVIQFNDSSVIAFNNKTFKGTVGSQAIGYKDKMKPIEMLTHGTIANQFHFYAVNSNRTLPDRLQDVISTDKLGLDFYKVKRIITL
jgi:hypothetical protein